MRNFHSISSFLFVAFLLIAPEAFEISEPKSNVYPCIYTYLKNHHLLDAENFITYHSELEENFNCDSIVEEKRNSFYDLVKKDYDDDKEFALHSECILEKLNSFYLGDAYLQKYVYISDESMTTVRREEALSKVIKTIATKKTLAEQFCTPEITFGEAFDKLYADTNLTESEGEEESLAQLQDNYCLVTHLYDTKTFDDQKYYMVANPEKIDVTDLDCKQNWHDQIVEYQYELKNVFADGFKSVTYMESRCYLKTIKDSKFSERLALLWAFSDIRISEDNRIAERASYINFMTNLFADIEKCVKK